MMGLRVVADLAVYFVVRLVICFIQAIRIETCQTWSRRLAHLLYRRWKVRRKVIDENLAVAFPHKSVRERENIAERMWEHLLLMMCEVAQAPRKIHEATWWQYVAVRNRRRMVSFLLDRRPVVIVSGHFGNFEVSGYMLGLLGVPTFTVARPLDNPYLDRFLNRFREAKGQFIIEKKGTALEIDGLLARGGKLVMLGDQSAGPKGCWVDFLGRPASCHKAIAVFPLTAGAPLVTAFGIRTDKPLHFEIGMTAAIDPAEPGAELGGVKPVTQWYNHRLEELIREHPEQYWWVHRRWKDQPPKRNVARAAA